MVAPTLDQQIAKKKKGAKSFWEYVIPTCDRRSMLACWMCWISRISTSPASLRLSRRLDSICVHRQHGQQRQCLDLGNEQPPLPHICKLVAAENGETLHKLSFCDFCGLPVWWSALGRIMLEIDILVSSSFLWTSLRQVLGNIMLKVLSSGYS